MQQGKTPIHKVGQIFESLDLTVKFIPAHDPIPYDMVVSTLGMDEHGKPIIVQVQQLQQMLEDEKEQKNQKKTVQPSQPFTFLSFVVTMPLQIPENTSVEILRLIALANKSLPLGFLNYSEIEHAVYYSYTFPVFGNDLSEDIVLTIVNAILFSKDSFFPLIYQVALGHETVESLLEG